MADTGDKLVVLSTATPDKDPEVAEITTRGISKKAHEVLDKALSKTPMRHVLIVAVPWNRDEDPWFADVGYGSVQDLMVLGATAQLWLSKAVDDYDS